MFLVIGVGWVAGICALLSNKVIITQHVSIKMLVREEFLKNYVYFDARYDANLSHQYHNASFSACDVMRILWYIPLFQYDVKCNIFLEKKNILDLLFQLNTNVNFQE